MISISSFDISNEFNAEEISGPHNFVEVATVNGFEERLETWIYANETTRSGYRNFRVVTDEVIDYTARVKGEYVDKLVVQQLYQVFFHPVHKRFVAICNKREAFRVAEIFENQFNLRTRKHQYDIAEIINQSSEVHDSMSKLKQLLVYL